MNGRRIGLIAGVAVAIFVLDRITKAAVVASIPLHETREVLGPFVRISHVRNTGAAFGLFQDRTTILSILSVVAVLAILYYYRALAMRSPWMAGTLGMQLGGAFGNLVDRLQQGYVVDFIDVGLDPGPRFWSFNVADSSIVLGIIAVAGMLWWSERGEARAGSATSA